jgi:transcriptional regulator with XRE-family HTH domain
MALSMERSNSALVAAFASTLREERLRRGLTQEDLAEGAEISARFVSLLETGRRQPSLSALAAVSNGLGLSMSALIASVEKRLGANQ